MSKPQLIARVRSKADVDAAVKAGFKAIDYNVDASIPQDAVSGLEAYVNVAPSVLDKEASEVKHGTTVYQVRLYSALNYVWEKQPERSVDNRNILWDLQKTAPLAVRDMDAAHLRLFIGSGYRISTLRVRMSLLDRRCELNGLLPWCRENKVKVLAYDTEFGGFLDAAEGLKDAEEESDGQNASHAEYVRSAGGWDVFRAAIKALESVAQRHSVPLSALSAAYVASLGVDGIVLPPTASKLPSLTTSDVDAIRSAVNDLKSPRGDPGDETKYPAYLSALPGDPKFNHKRAERITEIERIAGLGGRIEASSGARWEPVAEYSRGLRVGRFFEVAGTTARAHPSGKGCLGKDAEDQATQIFDIVAGAVHAVGGDMRDVTRTRVLLKDVEDWPGQCKVHGRVFGRFGVRPVDTMVGGTVPIIEGSRVEIEALGVIGGHEGPLMRVGMC